uniref:Uncharacterized protein n=1 Tax=Panagrolaimus sp. ES5 TaxID=591445 RepID=A0AC34FWI3_9BILA
MVDPHFADSYNVEPQTILIESERIDTTTVTHKFSMPCDTSLTLKLVEVTKYSLTIDDVNFFADNPEVVIALKSGSYKYTVTL